MIDLEPLFNMTKDGYVRCPRCRKVMKDDPKIWNSPTTILCPHCDRAYLFSVKRYPGKTERDWY